MRSAFLVLLLLALQTLPESVFSSDSLQAPQLIAPPNNSAIISDTLFDWTPVPGATSYFIQFTMGISVILDSAVTTDSLRLNLSGGPTMSDIYWHVRAINQQGNGPYSAFWRIIILPAGINKISDVIPVDFYLRPNYPNPFNSETIIEFGVPVIGNITLQIFDVEGRFVETIIDRSMESGTYSVKWDAGRYSSGIYFCRLSAHDFSSVQKLVVLK